MEAVDTLEYKGYTIKVIPEECPESPREWDNLSIWHCWHKKVDLGDENYNLNRQADVDDLKKTLRQAKSNNDVVMPLYIYQHSGIVLSLTPFSCQWDSGQVGYVIIPREKILAEFMPGKKRLSAKNRERAEKVAAGEIETYNQYACGDVYGYKIIDSDDEEVESCWGFYGEDNGTDNVMNEGKTVVDHITKSENEKWENFQKNVSSG